MAPDNPRMATHTSASVQRIAVVIPTFERRDLVLRAIESALTQNRTPDEVVVVDGCSTDGTAEAITNSFGSSVTLLERENAGPSPARNAAINATSCNIVTFLDSDNQWLPHHLNVIEELFDLHPTAVLVGTSRDYYFDGRETSAAADSVDVCEKLILSHLGVGYLSSVGIRRDQLVVAGLFDPQGWFGEDVDLFFRLSLIGPFALISTRTFVRGVSKDSLQKRAEDTGGYLHLLRNTATTVLAQLDSPTFVDRPDVDRIRVACRARQAVGVALAGTVLGEPPRTVRSNLREAFNLAPSMATIDWIDLALPLPRGEADGRRELAWEALALSWPAAFDRSSRGESIALEVRLRGRHLALRNHHWVHWARLSASIVWSLANPDGARRAVAALSARIRR